jgi:flavin reductase (DIM6/NTAB) family NADH-FMN oxidoreductase RutF
LTGVRGDGDSAGAFTLLEVWYVDEQAKKTALRMIPYGLFICGVGKGDKVTASTINWVTQASFGPPLVVIGAKTDSVTFERIKENSAFSISVLATGQKDMAFAFFRHVDPEGNKLGGYEFETKTTGAPVFVDCPAWWECELVSIVEEGDHAIVVGKVIEAGVRDNREPLTLKECGVNYGG